MYLLWFLWGYQGDDASEALWNMLGNHLIACSFTFPPKSLSWSSRPFSSVICRADVPPMFFRVTCSLSVQATAAAAAGEDIQGCVRWTHTVFTEQPRRMSVTATANCGGKICHGENHHILIPLYMNYSKPLTGTVWMVIVNISQEAKKETGVVHLYQNKCVYKKCSLAQNESK